VPNTDDLAYGSESMGICLGSSREPGAWFSGRYLGLRLRRTGVSQTAAAEVGNFPEADRT
jgi:hypothetical protein